MIPDTLAFLAGASPYAWGAAGLLIVALALAVTLVRTRRGDRQAEPKPRATPEDRGTLIAAGIATVVSAQGMWQFFTRILPDVPWYLRVAMFAFIEIAVYTSAKRAKRNMRDRHQAGADGVAVWALTGLSAVLSTLEARSFAEHVFRLATPLVAAWLWERGMAIERIRLTGRGRIHWRLTPERILVRLGLAEPSERTAGEVDALRRLTRVALAADDMADAKPDSWKASRRLAQLKRRGRAMLTHTSVTTDRDLQSFLMTQLGVARGIAGLPAAAPAPFWRTAEVPLPAPSTDDEPTTERSPEGHSESSIKGTPEGTAETFDDAPAESAANTLADADGDGRGRPNDQDNRVAEKWLRARIRAGRMPTLTEIENKYGWGQKWARLRAQAARDQMEPQGYRFLPGNVVQPPPAEPITGPVNGAAVALAGGAE